MRYHTSAWRAVTFAPFAIFALAAWAGASAEDLPVDVEAVSRAVAASSCTAVWDGISV